MSVTTKDTTAPTAPGSLTATANSATKVTLAWTASTDNVGVDHYTVRRGTTTLVPSQTGLSFSDTTAVAVTSYTYSVIAYDAAGNASTAATVTVKTPAAPDTQAPSVPAGLAVTGVTVSSVSLAWSASTDNVATTGYEVYRAGVKIATTTTARTYTDTGRAASTAYVYTVLALDAAGNRSAQSVAITGTTATPPDTTPPVSPVTFTAVVSALNQVTVTWAAATDNVKVTGYKLSRGGVLITTTTALAYTDAGLTPGTAYSYSVVAVDAAGNASAAKSATVTTPLDAAPVGAGFAGAYFNNTTLSGAAIGRLDSTINFNWGSGAPMPGNRRRQLQRPVDRSAHCDGDRHLHLLHADRRWRAAVPQRQAPDRRMDGRRGQPQRDRRPDRGVRPTTCGSSTTRRPGRPWPACCGPDRESPRPPCRQPS